MNTIGTSTVSPELLGLFNKEIETYVKTLKYLLSEDKDRVKMPSRNLNDITKEYIEKSIIILLKTGIKRVRAKSISRYVFEKALETKMSETVM